MGRNYSDLRWWKMTWIHHSFGHGCQWLSLSSSRPRMWTSCAGPIQIFSSHRPRPGQLTGLFWKVKKPFIIGSKGIMDRSFELYLTCSGPSAIIPNGRIIWKMSDHFLKSSRKESRVILDFQQWHSLLHEVPQVKEWAWRQVIFGVGGSPTPWSCFNPTG